MYPKLVAYHDWWLRNRDTTATACRNMARPATKPTTPRRRDAVYGEKRRQRRDAVWADNYARVVEKGQYDSLEIPAQLLRRGNQVVMTPPSLGLSTKTAG